MERTRYFLEQLQVTREIYSITINRLNNLNNLTPKDFFNSYINYGTEIKELSKSKHVN
jgi:hypothetical protein